MKRIFFVFGLLIQVLAFAQKSEISTTLISQLRTNTAPSSTLRYYTINPGQEGFWYYDSTDVTSLDNTGIILVSSNGKRFRRIFSGLVNVKWFGAKGDGVTDDSPAFQTAINYFTSVGGATILIPAGIFRIKDIHIKTNITLTANQIAKNNWLNAATTTIKPAAGATKIFNFDSLTSNACIEHLNVDGLAATFPALAIAIDFNGNHNRIYDNNVTNVAGTALSIGTVQLARIEQNNFQGHSTMPALTGFTGGGLNLKGIIVDSDITGNEIGAGSKYSTLKNINRWSVGAYFEAIYSSNITNNIFENGDIGGYIKNGGYNNFSGNRWEVNAAEGLIIEGLTFSSFVGERFTNNSSSAEGRFDHLVLGSKAVGLRFISPNFSILFVTGTGNRKTRHAISNSNDGSFSKNELIAPIFYAPYYTKSAINSNTGYFSF